MKVYHGAIICCDEENTVAKYLAEDGGKIVYVGDELPARFSAWQRVELGDRALIPSFADTHIHFASFATFASGAYYSHIYKEYEIDGIWGISKSYHSFISDTYYPSLAQFGIVGIVLFILFWIYLIKKSLLYANVTRDMKLTVISILIIVFFAIENIADATFTSNRGLFFMMMLGLIYSDMNKAIKTNNTRSLNGLQQTFP